MTTARDELPEANQTAPAVGIRLDRSVRPASEAHKCVQAGGPKMCEHLKCTYEGMGGERYRCDVCGRSYFLDYEEMR